jgi:translation initiation factor 2 subunit 1
VSSAAKCWPTSDLEAQYVISSHCIRCFVSLQILRRCRRVSPEELKACEERYNKSKLVHSIMRHVAETQQVDLSQLYTVVAWPLYKLYGHAYDAFKIMVSAPNELWEKLKVSNEEGARDMSIVTDSVKEAVMKNIQRRMTPQPLKIRADLEMTCFQYGGVDHIKVRAIPC